MQTKKNDMGVSPVIAVILMVAITVVLAGVVFLWAQSFTEDAGGGATALSVDFTLSETGSLAAPVTTLVITPLKGNLDWAKYDIIWEGTPLTTQPVGTVAVGTDFTIDLDATAPLLAALTPQEEYNIRIIKIDDQSTVIDTDVVCFGA